MTSMINQCHAFMFATAHNETTPDMSENERPESAFGDDLGLGKKKGSLINLKQNTVLCKK